MRIHNTRLSFLGGMEAVRHSTNILSLIDISLALGFFVTIKRQMLHTSYWWSVRRELRTLIIVVSNAPACL